MSSKEKIVKPGSYQYGGCPGEDRAKMRHSKKIVKPGSYRYGGCPGEKHLKKEGMVRRNGIQTRSYQYGGCLERMVRSVVRRRVVENGNIEIMKGSKVLQQEKHEKRNKKGTGY